VSDALKTDLKSSQESLLFMKKRISHNSIRILCFSLFLIFASCKEYEFTSPYDTQNNLAAPTELSLIFRADTAVTLNWQFDFSDGVSYLFEVELSEDGSNYSLVQLIKDNVITATVGLVVKADKQYHFRVRAKADNNASGYVTGSGSITFPAPADLQVNLEADTAAVLQWQKTSSPALHHVVEQSINGQPYAVLDTLPGNQISVRFARAFLVGESNNYRIKAISKNNASGYSNEVTKSITFNHPGNVTAQLPTDTVAIIQWQDNTEIETGYEIFMSIDGGVPELVEEVPANTTQTEYLSDFFSGKTYTFSVCAKSAANGNTPFSSASAQFNLMQVTGLSVEIPDIATAKLRWTNSSGYAREIVIEQSSDGTIYFPIKQTAPDLMSAVINGMYHFDSMYNFRIRTETKNNYGTYDSVTFLTSYFGLKWIFVQNGPTGNFYMSETEVTFEQYDYFCAQTRRSIPIANFGRGRQPVINVNVADAVAFCNWLSEQTGYTIRLPNENEWEFAAKGGIYTSGYTYSGSNNLNLIGWYFGNSGGIAHEVKGKKPNELGLFDMSGNVNEWTGTGGFARGGSWVTLDYQSTVSYRYDFNPADRLSSIGFRLLRNP